MKPPPTLLVFDVNETLLDLGGLRTAFSNAFGGTDQLGEWFLRMLLGAMVANGVGQYRPFLEIGAEAMLVVAERHGVELTPDRAVEVVSVMRSLPPHPDVPAAMDRLTAAGVRKIALTNGSQATVEAQLDNAGIAHHFETMLSVESVRRFKPAPEVYLMASARTDVSIDHMMMVAAHDWDLVGARSVGMQTAFISRPGAVWSPGYGPPDIVGATLGDIADQVIVAASS